jgi:hypothetical protein
MENLEKAITQLLDFKVVDTNNRPVLDPLVVQLKNLPALQWNSKVLGGILAEHLFKCSPTSLTKEQTIPFSAGWKAVKYEDYLQNWFNETCLALHYAPILHRKLWEDVYVVNTLRHFGKLAPGMRGLAFGVGTEPLPSYFASLGAEILATDLDISDQMAKGWAETNQHGSLEKLFRNYLVDVKSFKELVKFRYADMNTYTWRISK